jgi:hypothetical protein
VKVTNSETAIAMAVTVVMAITAATEESLVGLEEAIEAMKTMEATATDSKRLAVTLVAIVKVGCSSARASCIVVDTNNRVGMVIRSRVAVVVVVAVLVVVVEVHVFMS